MKREELATRSPASPPERIAALLSVVRILLGYGRHLADTINHRAAAPSFTTIAACFGTIDLSVILGHLHRGILRAAALERVLLARAARGRDVAFTRSRIRAQGRKPAPADADQDAANPAARKPEPRPLRRVPHNADADFHTPTHQELERQVRSRPVGRTIVDICLDLAVVPGFCTGPFWNALFDAMHWYGGSTASVMREKHRREQAFHREQDRVQPRAGTSHISGGNSCGRCWGSLSASNRCFHSLRQQSSLRQWRRPPARLSHSHHAQSAASLSWIGGPW